LNDTAHYVDRCIVSVEKRSGCYYAYVVLGLVNIGTDHVSYILNDKFNGNNVLRN
jgi:hypothetical protein